MSKQNLLCIAIFAGVIAIIWLVCEVFEPSYASSYFVFGSMPLILQGSVEHPGLLDSGARFIADGSESLFWRKMLPRAFSWIPALLLLFASVIMVCIALLNYALAFKPVRHLAGFTLERKPSKQKNSLKIANKPSLFLATVSMAICGAIWILISFVAALVESKEWQMNKIFDITSAELTDTTKVWKSTAIPRHESQLALAEKGGALYFWIIFLEHPERCMPGVGLLAGSAIGLIGIKGQKAQKEKKAGLRRT